MNVCPAQQVQTFKYLNMSLYLQGMDVAVKLLSPGFGAFCSTLAQNGEARRPHLQGLDSELAIMGRLDHPHVLRVYGGCLYAPEGRLAHRFIVEELCESSLGRWMYRNPQPLPMHEVFKV